jgi:hypothetical protein
MMNQKIAITTTTISTGTGMLKNGRAVPMPLKPVSRSVCPCAITSCSPRSTASMPSVVISALTPTTVTKKPLTIPMPIPARITTSTAQPCAQPRFVAVYAISTPQKPAPDPTDRSNCPAISSSVAGPAMIPITEMFVRMLSQLSQPPALNGCQK